MAITDGAREERKSTDPVSKARAEFALVAICGAILIAFAIWAVVFDNLRPIASVVLIMIGAAQSLPLLLWRTPFHLNVAEGVAVLSALAALASVISVGPIFFAPAAFLAADGARRLRAATAVSSSG